MPFAPQYTLEYSKKWAWLSEHPGVLRFVQTPSEVPQSIGRTEICPPCRFRKNPGGFFQNGPSVNLRQQQAGPRKNNPPDFFTGYRMEARRFSAVGPGQGLVLDFRAFLADQKLKNVACGGSVFRMALGPDRSAGAPDTPTTSPVLRALQSYFLISPLVAVSVSLPEFVLPQGPARPACPR